MLLQYIDSDCQDKILTQMCYLDQLCCKMVNRASYENVKLNFKEIFIKRLLQHEVIPDYDLANQFCDKMKETGSVIAGSFILDVLYDTNDHFDIDCYDQTNLTYQRSIIDGFNVNDRDPNYRDTLKFTQYLYQSNFECVSSDDNYHVKIRNFVHNSQTVKLLKDSKESVRSPSVIPNIDGEKYKNYKHSLQIIPIGMDNKEGESSCIPRFINATFDLEICQNYFDGEKVYLRNINKLVKKVDFILPNTKFILSYYVSDIDDSENNTMKRIKKYQERGFNITKHPDYERIKNDIDNIVSEARKHDRYYNVFRHVANGEIDLSKY